MSDKSARPQLWSSRSENVAKELRQMIEDSKKKGRKAYDAQPDIPGRKTITQITEDLLMQKLVAYYSRLSASVFNHGIAIGIKETKEGRHD